MVRIVSSGLEGEPTGGRARMSDPEPDSTTFAAVSLAQEALIGRMVFESLHDGVLLCGPRGAVAAANPAAARLLGMSESALISGEPIVGRLVWPDGSLLTRDDCPVRLALVSLAPQLGVLVGLLDDDVVCRWMELNVRPLVKEGRAFAAVMSIRDVTADRRFAEELRIAEHRQRLVLEHAVGGYAIIGERGEVLDGSASLLDLSGEPLALSRSVGFDSVHPADRPAAQLLIGEARRHPGVPQRAELRVTDKRGDVRWIELTATDQRHEPAARGVIVNFTEITERKSSEAASIHQATHDHITQLPNRRLLGEQLDELLAQSTDQVAVIFFDVDHFKVVNDSSGHAAGDQVLRELARRFRNVVRQVDRIARFGGDEFVVLCQAVSLDEAVAIGQRFLDVVHVPFDVDGVEQTVTISAGLALSAPGDSTESLLRDADTALNTAKERGRARLVVFDEQLRQETTRRLAIQTGLERVTQRHELSLAYQPIMRLDRSGAAGCEALLRWNHPQLGSVTPNDFIPIAERSGAIVELGRWVTLTAIAQLAAWHADGSAHQFWMSINVSARQLLDPGFVPMVGQALAEAQIDPRLVHLEVTESALMEDVAGVVERLDRLKAIGVGLNIDDFGTGYSSLSYLKRLPIDTLKIDRSFVDGLGLDPHDTSIARAVVSLADALELEVIAEGVETELQAAELRSLGCHLAQGFLWQRPLPPAELWQWLVTSGHVTGS
ncbi:MAG: putative bifunctional diguanylate cyclase/phosphodiesterase [Acidimicrobiales bacterium]